MFFEKETEEEEKCPYMEYIEEQETPKEDNDKDEEV